MKIVLKNKKIIANVYPAGVNEYKKRINIKRMNEYINKVGFKLDKVWCKTCCAASINNIF